MSTGMCWPLSVNQSVGNTPVAAENRKHPNVDKKLADSAGSNRFTFHSWPGSLRRQSIRVEGEVLREFDASKARLQSAIAGRRILIFTGMCPLAAC